MTFTPFCSLVSDFYNILSFYRKSYNYEVIQKISDGGKKLRNSLDPDPDWDFWLDPNPDSMNMDPKHWIPDPFHVIEAYLEIIFY